MRKSQSSMEFIFILLFILLVVGLVMVVLGEYSIEVTQDEIEAEVNDFNEKIQYELDLLSEVEGGYYREVEIPSYLMKRFNVTINAGGGYFYLRDYESYGRDVDKLYYYEIPYGLNVTLFNDSGDYYLILIREKEDLYEGIVIE